MTNNQAKLYNTGLWRVCISLTFLLAASSPLWARDPKHSSLPATGPYDSSADIVRINALLKDECYFESSSPRAPSGLVEKRKCLGQLDDKGNFTLHVEDGYGLPDRNNGFVILTLIEDWKISWHDLAIFPWILEDIPPGTGGIALTCRNNQTCGLVSYTAYSEDGKRLEVKVQDEKASQVPTIPVNLPMSRIVEEFFRPLERLITPNHTDARTCSNIRCVY
jgi:hypothetical protein